MLRPALFPYLFGPAQLAARAAFYRTDHPAAISVDAMVKRYGEISAERGFHFACHFVERRNVMSYLVLKVSNHPRP